MIIVKSFCQILNKQPSICPVGTLTGRQGYMTHRRCPQEAKKLAIAFLDLKSGEGTAAAELSNT